MKNIIYILLILVFTNISNSQWVQLNSPTGTQLRSVYFVNEMTGWICGDSAKIFKTTNEGIYWIEQSPFLLNYLFSIQMINAFTGFTSGGTNNDGKILKTTNGGTNWIIKHQSSYNGLKVMFPDNQLGIAIGYQGIILKTTNGGESWQSKTFNSTDFYALYILNSTIGWIGGGNGELYKTTDGGETFYPQNSMTTEHIRNIIFLDQNTGFFCGGSNQNGNGIIYKSSNGGLSWNSKFTCADTILYSVKFVNLNTGYVSGFFGTILMTTDGGNTWNKQITNINNFLLGSFFTTSLTGYVVGDNGIILKTTNGGITFVNNDIIINKFELKQNYPNPFNPKTVISFSIWIPSGQLTVNSYTQLKVFDVLGREVATLVNEQLQPGTYEVEWDGSKYSSGIYYYRLYSGDPFYEPTGSKNRGSLRSGLGSTETKKMILIK